MKSEKHFQMSSLCYAVKVNAMPKMDRSGAHPQGSLCALEMAELKTWPFTDIENARSYPYIVAHEREVLGIILLEYHHYFVQARANRGNVLAQKYAP